MPTDACVALYDCNGCGETLKPIWFANPLTASQTIFLSLTRSRVERAKQLRPARNEIGFVFMQHHDRLALGCLFIWSGPG